MDKCRVLNFFFLWVAFCFAKKSEKCIAFSRPEFALQTRAFQGYVRTSCYLHSFATLRNWLRQPLQSLPQFKIKKLEIEPNNIFKERFIKVDDDERKYHS